MRLIDVLKKGSCVKNVVFWKKAQMFLVMTMGFLPLFPQINPDLLTQLNIGIGGVIVYLTAATTDKIGA